MERPRIDRRDWSVLSLGERIRQVEVEGYLVLPDLLDPDHVGRLKGETARLETAAVEYSVHQRYCNDIQWSGGLLTELVAHQPAIAFLGELLGAEILVANYVYARSEPGHPGISLHTDGGQPYGSRFFGYEVSVPVAARVLYYLDDLTPDVAPFRVLPCSHLSMHAEGNPYGRFDNHPGEVMVPVRTGSAVVINHRVFHGNYPNVGERSREMLALSYRPAWAGPIAAVKDWEGEKVARLTAALQAFFGDRNTRHWAPDGGNKPENMLSEASGIDPSRWERMQ